MVVQPSNKEKRLRSSREEKMNESAPKRNLLFFDEVRSKNDLDANAEKKFQHELIDCECVHA